MQASKFNNLYHTLLENMTSVSVLGTTQVSQFSKDNYAPGDTRIPKILGIGIKKKKKKKIKESFPIIRRTLPGM